MGISVKRFAHWLALVLRAALSRLRSKAPALKRGAQPAAGGWLLITTALVLLTPPWWVAAIPVALAGVLLPGFFELRANFLLGFAKALGWTDGKDAVE